MTTIDRTNATDAEFAERIAAFETATVPVEIVREQVAAAISSVDHAPEHGSSPPWTEVHDEFRDAYLRMADAALAVVAHQPHPAVQRVVDLHTRSWFRIGPETEPRHDGISCSHCDKYWGSHGCPTIRAIKDVDLLGRPLAGDPR